LQERVDTEHVQLIVSREAWMADISFFGEVDSFLRQKSFTMSHNLCLEIRLSLESVGAGNVSLAIWKSFRQDL